MKLKRETPFASAVAGKFIFQRLFCVFALPKLKLDPSLKKIKIKLLSAEFDRTFALVANAVLFRFFKFIEANKMLDFLIIFSKLSHYSIQACALLFSFFMAKEITLMITWRFSVLLCRGVENALLFQAKKTKQDHLFIVILTAIILIMTFWSTVKGDQAPLSAQLVLVLACFFLFRMSSLSTQQLKAEGIVIEWQDFILGLFITLFSIVLAFYVFVFPSTF